MPDRDMIVDGLEAIREFFGFGLPSQLPTFEAYQNILTDAIVMLKEPERITGHWIDSAGDDKCSVCGATYSDLYPDYSHTHYCPNCGAEMKGRDI